MATLTGVYGETLVLEEFDLSRLAFEYRNCQDRGALNLIAIELQRRDDARANGLEAVGRLRAWIRDFGDQKQPAFIRDLEAVLDAIALPPPAAER